MSAATGAASRWVGALVLVGVVCLLAAVSTGEGGCAIVVGDAVPPFNCVPGVAGVCPAGSVCVPATHVCAGGKTCATTGCRAGLVCDLETLECTPFPPEGGLDATSGSDADLDPDAAGSENESGEPPTDDATSDGRGATDAIAEASDALVSDAIADATATCRAVTCKCGSPSDCQSGICADSLTVTQPLYMANASTSFCTQSCCASADCPASTVCFGTGAGGNYCVSPSWIGRAKTLGAALGGGACKVAGDCRSGLCVSGACADTCCSTAQENSECGGGSVCRFAAFPGNTFDVHETAWCGGSLGSGAGGSPCALDGECQSGKCSAFMSCQAACRSSADCGVAGQACIYGPGPGPLMSTKDIVAGCLAGTGPQPEGAACSVNTDCQSDFCDAGHCTDVCFADSDCKAGSHCLPKMVSVQSGGSYSVLCCQG